MSTQNRWYDKHPQLSDAIHKLMMFPDAIQTILAVGLTQLADTDYHANHQNKLKSLGSDKVLALYKSKQKKRDYDANPALHQAMNCLSLLSETEQLAMANHLQAMSYNVKEYLCACKTAKRIPSQEEMIQLTQLYVEKGPEACHQYFKDIHRQINYTLDTLGMGKRVIQINDEEMKLFMEELNITGPNAPEDSSSSFGF